MITAAEGEALAPANRKEGQGTMRWKNGDRWEGIYRNDAQAEGTLTRKDG